jgi:HD-like signal output (HDOD) protein
MWNLPPPIADAAAFHHDPASSVEPSRLSQITACVDEALAHVGFAGNERLVDPFDNPVFLLAGLSGEQGEALLAFTEMLMETPEAWMLSYEESQGE